MYKTKDNKEIGKYLSGRIDKKFGSQRQFGIAYLKAQGNIKPDDGEIQNMANRVSQIVNGNKAVQLDDFPIFTELLDTSCEEILSAGECSTPTANHMTNYNVAFSTDKAVWKAYVHREDKLMLNLDEYGKTVIEYALDFKNFAFLKYLIENKYLWFVDAVNDPNDFFRRYSPNFGIGTNIERRLPPEHFESRWYISYRKDKSEVEHWMPYQRDTLQYELAGNDNLRMRMIALAVEHNDIELLDLLRAREIPSLYQACFITYRMPECDRYYDEDMVQCIVEGSEEVLDYFAKEFEIKDMYGYTNRFLFPYMSNLIDILIQKDSIYAEKMLTASIKHNRKALEKLKKLKRQTIDDRINYFTELYQYSKNANIDYTNIANDDVIKSLSFHDDGNIVCYRDATKTLKVGMITNIIHTNKKTDNKKISSLIQQLNGIYKNIRNKKI